ncbi:SMP-30/gluconolactonase/LRE family protein [Rhodococcoides corynebacterioides]|uniref:SMP-30/gluconolactonase/LRE family protein n=1 Tax=Rhodococcoides corynebacterioides TaxID=53972 RepID=UPI001C9BABF7|nr:SMP-30/gluconolactonase/LRE family protein [Rhodococcus corynebacterioides]MBY6362489.1 SMP-30/gluconolactonase/LRE family protein [Rhodococcus corynebacterioides]
MTITTIASETIADGFSFLEAPRWFEDSLFFSDFYTHRVLRLRGDTIEEVCRVPGQPSGLGFMPSGRLRIVSMLTRSLLEWTGRELTTVADLSGVLNGTANDMVIDSRGNAYIGCFGDDALGDDAIEPTVVVRVDADGSARVVADELNFPNGMALTEDETVLIVAETFANRITAFDVSDSGDLTGRREWARFGRELDHWSTADNVGSLDVLPDGLASDQKGGLWVADASGHGIARVLEHGEVTDFVDTGDLAVYSACIGGVDNTTLYLCCAPPFGTDDPTVSRNGALLRADIGSTTTVAKARSAEPVGTS